MFQTCCFHARLALAAAAVVACGAARGVTPYYSLLDVQTLGGIKSEAWGVNNAGQVVGWSKMPDGSNRAFLTLPNSPINPVTDAIPLLPGATANYAYAVNASGQAAGDNTIASGDRAFRLSTGNANDLGTLGGTWSYGYDINSLGRVVGGAAKPKQGSNYPTHAFLHNGTAMFDLGTLGGQDSYAFGINSSGKIVGYSQTSGGAALDRAFVWTPSTSNGTSGTMVALNTLGGSTGYAFAINDNGDIVGGAQTQLDAAYHAFYRPTGSSTLIDLGTLGGPSSEARAVNSSATIVGNADSPSGQRAFVYSGSAMRDLNDAVSNLDGWTLTSARDINDSGQIVGFGTNSGGQTRGFLLTPLPTWKINAGGVWSTPGNWLGTVPNSPTAEACFTDAITTACTVTVDAAVSLRKLTFDNANAYTLAGTLPIGLGGVSIKSGISVIRGNHSIQTPIMMAGTLDLAVAANATLTISGSVDAALGASITKTGDGQLKISRLVADSFSAASGATVIPLAASPWQVDRTSKVTVLTLAPGATLDLGNSALIIDYSTVSPLDQIRSLLQLGYNGGDWTGVGMMSSAAAANPSKYSIGYAEASQLGASSFAGATFSGNAVVAAYALVGDVNLDGKVNTIDFNELAGAFGSAGLWQDGDSNYDQQIDSVDFNALAANYGNVLPISVAGLGTIVPEPVCGSLLSFLAFMFRRVSHSRSMN